MREFSDFLIPKCGNHETLQGITDLRSEAQDMCCMSAICNKECENYGDMCLFDSENSISAKSFKLWSKDNFKQWSKIK